MTSRSLMLAITSGLFIAACAERADSPTAPSAAATASAEKTWVVAFKNEGLPADVDRLVADAGGTIVLRIPEIGGIAVNSANPDFGTAIKGKATVLNADPALETKAIIPQDGPGTASADNNGGNFSAAGPDPQPMPDNLGHQQWDKMRMNATASPLTGSYARQPGRRDVLVAILDTGADQFHPDIQPNLVPQSEEGGSKSFVGIPLTIGGVVFPAEPTIQDFNGHGTWCMSAVAAPINVIGISGVAPNVMAVSLKVLNAAGRGLFIWTDAALVYAGTHKFDIASMSLGGYLDRRGDKAGGDHTDYILLHRAVQFARRNGVLPVAALGNDNFNVSDGSFFRSFVEAPGEIAGVVGVSATGYYNQKAHYSNYGTGKTDVSAPGGATRDYTGVPGSGSPPPPYLGQGRVLGAWSTTGSSIPNDPNLETEQCTGPGGGPPCFPYAYIQGTSMATPHVAGVAALIISEYGTPDMSPTQVETILQTSANNQPCPEPRTVNAGVVVPPFVFQFATCSGGVGYNNFFGKGIVDAFKAVTLH